MKNKKALLISLCAIMLVAATIFGTLAYLTSTDEVINTFTVGNVAITLDEAPVDENGQATTGNRVKANSYKLLPGHEYDKDPEIHVDANSEDCWLFVKVVNEISTIEADTTIAAQMAAKGWDVIDAENGIYAYEAIVEGGADVPVFESFKILGTVKDLSTYDSAKITVTAYAIQADGFASAEAAWTAANGEFTA